MADHAVLMFGAATAGVVAYVWWTHRTPAEATTNVGGSAVAPADNTAAVLASIQSYAGGGTAALPMPAQSTAVADAIASMQEAITAGQAWFNSAAPVHNTPEVVATPSVPATTTPSVPATATPSAPAVSPAQALANATAASVAQVQAAQAATAAPVSPAVANAQAAQAAQATAIAINSAVAPVTVTPVAVAAPAPKKKKKKWWQF